MISFDTNTPTRRAAIHGLAVVGFLTLIALGMSLAVYSARYVPSTVGRLGAAAVSLSQIFTPASSPSLSVVPTASTTIPFDTASSTASTSVTHATVSTPAPQPVTPTAGAETGGTYQLGGGAVALSGLPDLIVTINAVGYLTSTSTSSFVATTTVPYGENPAVKFTVKNIGTNVAGPWRFSASIPTSSDSIYQSVPQQSLNPGDYIEYTLGFSQPNAGANQTISVTANFDHAVTESNTNNNSASAKITILGN
ncbi:MAG: CARDB domain-containing protein [Minisyncoccota bacterium]